MPEMWGCGHCPRKFGSPAGVGIHIGKMHKQPRTGTHGWPFPAIITRRMAGLRHAPGLRVAEGLREGA